MWTVEKQEEQQWLGLAQGAKLAGVAYNTFKGAIRRGEIPVYHIRGRRYVQRGEVVAWREPSPASASQLAPVEISSIFPRVSLDT